MRIALVTTLQSETPMRLALARLSLRYHREVSLPGVEFVQVAACTLPEDEDACREMGVRFTVTSNDDVSGKHNEAYLLARGCDGTIFVGSDDFLSLDYLRGLISLVWRGHSVITTSDLWFYDALTGRCIRKPCARTGAGRYVAAEHLEACHWQPYASGLSRGLDGAIETTLDAMGAEHTRMGPAGPLLDVKSDFGMWTFDKFVPSSTKVSTRAVFSHYPAWLQQALRGVVEEAAPRSYYEASTLGDLARAAGEMLQDYPRETPIGFIEDGRLTFMAMRACLLDENMKVTDEGQPAVLVY